MCGDSEKSRDVAIVRKGVKLSDSVDLSVSFRVFEENSYQYSLIESVGLGD